MKKILIVVDVQSGFIKNAQTREVAHKIAALTNAGIFDCVVATRFINEQNSVFMRFLKWYGMTEYNDVKIHPGVSFDYAVDKSLYTCIDKSFLLLLEEINDNESPKEVFVCGVDTDACVLKIAADLFEQSVYPIVLTDYCASGGSVDAHNAGIQCLGRLIGSKALIDGDIVDADQIDKIVQEINERCNY